MNRTHGATVAAGIAITGVLAAIFALNAPEGEKFTACTQDGRKAAVEIHLHGSVKGEPTLKDVADFAWKKSASEMTGEQLASPDGFTALRNNVFEVLDNREIAIPMESAADVERARSDPFSALMQIMPGSLHIGAPGSCTP